MDEILASLGMEIDAAADREDVIALHYLIDKCKENLTAGPEGNDSLIYFFEANCHSVLASLREDKTVWSWNQADKLSEVLCLRRAVSGVGFASLNKVFKAKIYTNLGNVLNSLGRFIEAIRYWDSALSEIPNFAMALGNKGIGLFNYAQSLYDYGHGGVLIAGAEKNLTKALSRKALWESGADANARLAFSHYKKASNRILKGIEYNQNFSLDGYSLGRSRDEKLYRKWALHNKLFLSPLNDLHQLSISSRDTIHLPSHRYSLDEKPRFPNYFNLLKQEYISARYSLFEAVHGKAKHFSDNEALLMNGYDGVYFGYRTEQIKIAYRLGYSTLDKVALFINEYFSVGLNPSQVSFKRLWGEEKKGAFALREIFIDRENWPLRGLYFLSRDLFDTEFVATALPEAEKLSDIRNKAEHRFLSLQEFAFGVESTEIHTYITVDEFTRRTLKVLSMARESLIYLSLAMHREEQRRRSLKGDDGMVMEIPSSPL
ncbi:LA2681 family HEPN domain-containing protein [Pseudomonas sp. DSP3-2-2]|uniref:LA2681 family HEPN domain-containing protein n=1 Tax=unclassified Pseudomonas TaxID=196821 RepID=UPI003CF0B9BE